MHTKQKIEHMLKFPLIKFIIVTQFLTVFLPFISWSSVKKQTCHQFENIIISLLLQLPSLAIGQ